MSALSTVIDDIIDRIERWTPSRDPKNVFNYRDYPEHDRDFMFDGDIEIESPQGILGVPFICNCSLVFNYIITTEVIDDIRNITDDAHEIFERISFYPGNEWTANAEIIVTGLSIISEEDSHKLKINLKLIYSA